MFAFLLNYQVAQTLCSAVIPIHLTRYLWNPENVLSGIYPSSLPNLASEALHLTNMALEDGIRTLDSWDITTHLPKLKEASVLSFVGPRVKSFDLGSYHLSP